MVPFLYWCLFLRCLFYWCLLLGAFFCCAFFCGAFLQLHQQHHFGTGTSTVKMAANFEILSLYRNCYCSSLGDFDTSKSTRKSLYQYCFFENRFRRIQIFARIEEYDAFGPYYHKLSQSKYPRNDV